MELVWATSVEDRWFYSAKRVLMTEKVTGEKERTTRAK